MAERSQDQVVLSLYEAALSPDKWSGVLRSMRTYLRTDTAAITFLSASNACIGAETVGIDDAHRRSYVDYYQAIDVLSARLRDAPARAYTLQALIGRDELARSEFYQDFMRHTGTDDTLQVVGARGDGARFILTLGRDRGTSGFSAAERRRLERIVPHFLLTGRVRSLLREADSRRGLALATLDRLANGIVLLDETSAVLHFNQAARSELLAAGSGLGLRHGRLFATDPAAGTRLEALIRTAAEAGVGGGLTLSGNDRRLMLFVTPVLDDDPAGDAFGSRAAVMVLITRPDAGERPEVEQHLTALFGLTPRESRTAAAIAAGLSIAEIAGRFRISRETVRFHLKGVFAKTGARSQIDLVRQIERTLGPLRSAEGAAMGN